MTKVTMISVALGCALLTGRVANAAPNDTEADRVDTARQTFRVPLASGTTPENVIPAILAAGRVELANRCEATPSAAVRILNPLASGSYTDVSCSDILAASAEDTGQTSEALSSDSGGENLGEARQKFTPVGLACGFLSLLLGVATTVNCEKHPDNVCPYGALGGATTVGIICIFL